MIKGSGIYKRFGQVEVLKGIDVQIETSEIVSIVGASGSGKTTLLQVLSSLEAADSGTVEINGRPLPPFGSKALAALRNKEIGFVFQFHNLLEEFSGLENVCLPGLIGGRSLQECERDALPLLELLGISHRAKHKPSELSGGEQQRFAVARALINKPSVVFADEPSGNLDSKHAEELHRLFFDLRTELKQTFVIVTHHPGFAAMSDRQLHLIDGVISA